MQHVCLMYRLHRNFQAGTDRRKGWQSAPYPGRFTPGKDTRYPLYRGWVGFGAGRVGSGRSRSTVVRNPNNPARRESLYRLSYPDCLFSLKLTRVGTLIVATIYLQLIQSRYMFRSFTVLHCSHQHCVQPVASDVEFVGYLQQRLLC